MYLIKKQTKTTYLPLLIVMCEIFFSSVFLTLILKVLTISINDFIFAKTGLKSVVVMFCYYTSLLIFAFFIYLTRKNKKYISSLNI